MAHAKKNTIAGNLRGALGKELVFRNWDGETVVSKYPRRKRKPTPRQTAMRGKFHLGTRYAKSIREDPDPTLREIYATGLKPRQNIYSRALEDFMLPPVVKSINPGKYKGAAGGRILIRATDDFRVASVRTEIYSAAGALLEAGEARLDNRALNWVYTTTRSNPQQAGSKIKAIATDIPGNEGMLEINL